MWAPRWPGRAATGPAHSWPVRRARRAPSASSWLRAGRPGAPRAGGGAWPGGRRSPTHWPFVLQLCPSPSGSRAAPRPPRAVAPGKFASPAGPGRETPRAAPPPGSETSASQGLLDSCVPEGRRIRGKCAAGKGGREGERPESGRRPASPGPWPPDKGVLEVAEAHFIFPQRGLAKGRKLAEHTCVSLAGRGVCLRGSRRGPRLLPGKLVPSGEAGRDPRPRSGRMPEAGIPLTVEVPARGWGSCRWPGSPPASRLRAIPAGVLEGWCGPTR